jgi:hypothetical protein
MIIGQDNPYWTLYLDGAEKGIDPKGNVGSLVTIIGASGREVWKGRSREECHRVDESVLDDRRGLPG